MNAKPTLDRHHPVVVAACLATLIAIGILATVADLFQSRGLPMGELVAAERACGEHAYVSDREACVREWAAAARGDRVAGR